MALLRLGTTLYYKLALIISCNLLSGTMGRPTVSGSADVTRSDIFVMSMAVTGALAEHVFNSGGSWTAGGCGFRWKALNWNSYRPPTMNYTTVKLCT